MGCKVRLFGAVSGLFVMGVAGSLAGGMLTGCSVAPTAPIVTCNRMPAVLPTAAIVDHAATAPGNQQAFNVGYVGSMQGCPLIPEGIVGPSAYTWVSSDSVNAPVSNVVATAGVATCVGVTTVPVMISIVSPATVPVEVATLTCK